MNRYSPIPPKLNQAVSSPHDEGTVLPRRLKSVELFDVSREIIIEHHGKEYRLRVTSNDKLILTK
jgi:hemin uptake protein HemP